MDVAVPEATVLPKLWPARLALDVVVIAPATQPGQFPLVEIAGPVHPWKRPSPNTVETKPEPMDSHMGFNFGTLRPGHPALGSSVECRVSYAGVALAISRQDRARHDYPSSASFRMAIKCQDPTRRSGGAPQPEVAQQGHWVDVWFPRGCGDVALRAFQGQQIAVTPQTHDHGHSDWPQATFSSCDLGPPESRLK